MAANIIIVIIVTSLATYLSRFLGVISAEKIKETSKMFRWFNCLAYSTLAALIARLVVFPSGPLAEIDYLIRFIVVVLYILIFYLNKKNLVYPTLFSAIILSTIFWLSLSIEILLNLFFNPFAILLFREDMHILLYLIDEPHIPVITEDAIFPVPIKPSFIINNL
jgi:branched-subunit amino acid transport protein